LQLSGGVATTKCKSALKMHFNIGCMSCSCGYYAIFECVNIAAHSTPSWMQFFKTHRTRWEKNLSIL